jgi:FkbM family methyltransferase
MLLQSYMMLCILRHVWPLWLREKVYFHSPAQKQWPTQLRRAELQFAPVSLRHFYKSDIMHRQIAWLGFYELALSKRIAKMAGDGGILVDVGANVGYFSCLWAAVRAHNEVYAFEPSPPVFELLKANIEEAGLCSRVKVYKLALSKERANVDFDPGPNNQSGWGGISNDRSDNTLRIEAEKLDDVMPDNVVIDLLKIDTEGADAFVLKGADRLLRTHRIRHVFFEQNLTRMKRLGIPHDSPFRTLQACGYKVEALGKNKEAFHAQPA